MNPELKTTAEITADAIRLLCRELGPVNTARFIGQFTRGTGDYTRDRYILVGDPTVAEMVAEIKRHRDQS